MVGFLYPTSSPILDSVQVSIFFFNFAMNLKHFNTFFPFQVFTIIICNLWKLIT